MFNCFKFTKKNKINNNYNNEIQEYNIEINCIVCLNSYNSLKIKAFIPCGHRNCCNHCIDIIKNNNSIFDCPTCKSVVNESIIIYDNLILIK
jgi:Zn finger protein HypA/HybF involved in hydrogenase expression